MAGADNDDGLDVKIDWDRCMGSGNCVFWAPETFDLSDDGHAVVLDAVIKGNTVREVLKYVEFNTEVLMAKLRSDVESAVRAGRFDVEESGRLLRFYEDGLNGYTYLEDRR